MLVHGKPPPAGARENNRFALVQRLTPCTSGHFAADRMREDRDVVVDTLHSAVSRFAAEYGKTIFVLPGAPQPLVSVARRQLLCHVMENETRLRCKGGEIGVAVMATECVDQRIRGQYDLLFDSTHRPNLTRG